MKTLTANDLQEIYATYIAIPEAAKKSHTSGVFPAPHRDLHAFLGILDQKEFIEPFDWQKWITEIGADHFRCQKFLLTANLETLRKLITAHIRNERFFEGHLQSLFSSGYMDTWAARLHEITPSLD